MNTIALEDLVTLVCTEFVKLEKDDYLYAQLDKNGSYRFNYLKMNMAKRRKISEKILESLEKR
jgi:hypothetical protein